MNAKRLFIILAGVLGLLGIGLLAAAYGAQTVMATESNHLVSTRAKLGALSQQQTNLIEAKKELTTYASLYQISKVIVPEEKDQAETVRQIVKLAGQNGISLGSITFPSSTLGNTVATSPTAIATAPSAASAASSPSLPANRLSQLTPVPLIPGVYVLPITITSDTNKPASFDKLVAFLQSLEQNRLTAQVSSVNITLPSSTNNLISFSLVTNIYIKP